MKKSLKVTLISIGGVFAFVVTFMGGVLALPLFEKYDIKETTEIPAKKYDANNWMSHLDGKTKLQNVIMPGTHDAATSRVQLGFYARCQQYTIKEQLEKGYRYLDIRLRMDGDNDDLVLCHAFSDCTTTALPIAKKLRLSNVLEDCYNFLNTNKSETIVFAVKQEYGNEPIAEFEKTLNKTISKNKSNWLLTNELPTLEEARGKLVLLRRYNDDANLGLDSGIPLIWSDQGNKDHTEKAFSNNDDHVGSTKLYVQDRYHYNVINKWEAFTNKETKFIEDACVISFSSTAGAWIIGHPFSYATKLNKNIYELYKNEKPNKWTIVDFGGEMLARQIYKWNDFID